MGYSVKASSNPAVRVGRWEKVIDCPIVSNESEVSDEILLVALKLILPTALKVVAINRPQSTMLVLNNKGQIGVWSYCFGYVGGVGGPQVNYYSLGLNFWCDYSDLDDSQIKSDGFVLVGQPA